LFLLSAQSYRGVVSEQLPEGLDFHDVSCVGGARVCLPFVLVENENDDKSRSPQEFPRVTKNHRRRVTFHGLISPSIVLGGGYPLK